LSKTYSVQAQTGESGVVLIDQLVTEMGLIWHPRRIDHGIDGEIELVDPLTRSPLNRMIFVQSKASELPFPGEDAHGFHFDASPEDVDYWAQSNIPVIVVCSHPSTKEAWWASVTRAEPIGKRRTRRIKFDKKRDRLDKQSQSALLNLKASNAGGYTVRPPALRERLVSNLLAVERVAETIWASPTWLRRPRDAIEILRSRDGYCDDWILADGMLFSFTHPTGTPLEHLVEGPPEGIDTSEWSESKDPDVRRRFVQMLNQVLVDTRATDLRRHPDGWLFFRPTQDLRPRQVAVGRSKRGRTVFEQYMDRNDPDRVRHYRHYALKANFVAFDRQWFVELLPTYHYTFDGHREVPWASELLKGIKRLEKNDAVRRLIEFWAGYLGGGQQELFEATDYRLVFGDLVTFAVERGVHDASWAPLEPPEAAAGDQEARLW
jgi:hypothetical protein